MTNPDSQPHPLHQTSNRASSAKKRGARKRLLLATGAALVIAGAGYGAYALAFAGGSVSTDNAYTAVEVAQITPLIGGPVREVRVTDTRAVKAGDVLVILDDTDARIAVQQAQADLARARRQVRQLFANDSNFAAQFDVRGAEIRGAESDLARARANLDKAKLDAERRRRLVAEGGVSKQELTDAETLLADAAAAFTQAQAKVAETNAARAAAGGARRANAALIDDTTVDNNPAVLAAAAKLEQMRVNLERTVLRAPVDGIVTQRAVDVGQQVQPGARLMSIVPIGQIYVDANFKEVQLRNVRPGQPVRVTSDLYGDGVVYHGRVQGFAGGSGAAFSAIPAQNATGNWIKVVQRLPVRIGLDPRELQQHPLRVGLSMEAEVDLRPQGASKE